MFHKEMAKSDSVFKYLNHYSYSRCRVQALGICFLEILKFKNHLNSLLFFPPRNCVELEAGCLGSNPNAATYKFCDFLAHH